MKCVYKKQFFVILLFVFVVTTTFGKGGRVSSGRTSSSGRGRTSSSGGGGSSGGGFFSRIFGGGKSSSNTHSGSTHTQSNPAPSYPKQTYNTGSGTNTHYGWNTGGNKYNSNSGHYYNSPSSPTNWANPSYKSTSYSQPQNAFGSFRPVSSGNFLYSYPLLNLFLFKKAQN